MSILTKIKDRFHIDANTAYFIDRFKSRWPQRDQKSKTVVLVDLYDDNSVIYHYGHLSNFLADKYDARIASFHFGKTPLDKVGIRRRRLESIYESFGAKLELSFEGQRDLRREAFRLSRDFVAGLKDKSDVLKFSINGTNIGKFIYQSYLRKDCFTLDIHSRRMKRVAYDAFLIYLATRRYFQENEVKALIISHVVFMYYGLVAAVAKTFGTIILRVQIPAWRKGDFLTLLRVDEEHLFQEFPYWKYREIFASLPEPMKMAGLEAGRQLLEERLEGKSSGTFKVHRGKWKGTWAEVLEKPLTKETGQPKILMLLSCFFDGPHFFPNNLFPDFYEWAHFVLKQAQKSPYQWYIKPHPASLSRNEEVIEELKRTYQCDNIHFLPLRSPNRQLVQENIAAVLNQGTAVHEFAYFGIPVIAAGGNYHSAYDFFYQANTVEEYRDLLANAGKLNKPIDRTDIFEFVYMNYVFFYREDINRGVRLIDDGFEDFVAKKLGGNLNHSAALRYFIDSQNPRLQSTTLQYFQSFFDRHLVK